MKYIILALALSAISVSSFAKTYECQASLYGDRATFPVKFTVDTAEESHSETVLIAKSYTGRQIKARFVMESYLDDVMTIIIGEADKFDTDFASMSSPVEQTLDKESHLETAGYVKNGIGSDYTAKMACTLVQK